MFNGVMDLDAADPNLSVPATSKKKGQETRIRIKITNIEVMNFQLVASNHGPEEVN